MHTVLILQLDRTVSGHYPDGPTGVPCYQALNRTQPCPQCPVDQLNERRPQHTIVHQDGDSRWQQTLQLLPESEAHPAQLLETITPVSTTALQTPTEVFTALYPLYQYALTQHQPLSFLALRYRHTMSEAQLADLRVRFPRRFRDGSVVGELPGRILLWVAPQVSEADFARLAVRIRQDFPDPQAYVIQAWQAIPPQPPSLSFTHTIDTFTRWITRTTNPKTAPETTIVVPQASRPYLDAPAPIQMPAVETIATTPFPPIHDPVTQLDGILQRLAHGGPTLQKAAEQLTLLRTHQASAEALIFADLLAPYLPPSPTHGITQTTLIRDSVQLMDTFAKEAGRLLLELTHSGTLAQHGYATLGEFAEAIGLHPETAQTLMHLAALRRPLIQVQYADRVPGRPKPKPLGLFLQQDRRQTARRTATTPPARPDQRAHDRRQPPAGSRSTSPPSSQASA